MRYVRIAAVAGVLGCGGGGEADTGGSTGTTSSSTTGDAASSSSSSTGESSGGPVDPTSGGPGTGGPGPTTGTGDDTGTGTSDDTGTGSDDDSSTGAPAGPRVDVSDPQLREFEFTALEADPAATLALGEQLAALDTRVPPLGRLVVYLHGAGAPTTCGSKAHGQVLAGMGFHVVQPCYVSDYGVGNCGDDIGGCRLEAFEGVDHHDFIAIQPPDSIETRVVRMLEHLQAQHPGGDWQWFIVDGAPRWSAIVISGISHGASSSGVIGMHRAVDRAVMLSGPLDSGQAWLVGQPLTPIERFFGFTHTADEQHPGHLQSFADMQLPGEPAVVDGAAAPYGGSHRLVTSAATGDGHGSTQAGGASPKDGDAWVFLPVWRAMYGADE
jgi:hypothetical protein